MTALPGSTQALGHGSLPAEAGAVMDGHGIDGSVDVSANQTRQGADLLSKEDTLQRSGTLALPVAPTRPPPIFGIGFVQEEFQLHEMPLGLVIDWSMALPVVSSVVPDSFAARRPSLIPGLVLVAINKNGLRPGAKRTEVEARLRDTRQRPLWLVFEAPNVDRFDYSGARKRARRRNAWKAKYGNSPESKESRESRAPASEGLALTTQSFFEKHPERIPLSRYGELEVYDAPHFPQPPAATPAASSLRRVMSGPDPISLKDVGSLSAMRALHHAVKLPPVLRGGFASTFSGHSADHINDSAMGTGFGYSNSGVTSPRRTGVSWAGAETLRKAVSSKSLTWLAESTPRPDASYEHLVDEPRSCGPGLSERWPLNHEDTYICRLGDMVMAWRVRDAYEVGFRGRKREKVTEMHLKCDNGAPPLIKKVTRIDEVFCDMCGVDLASPSYLQQAALVNSVQETMGSGVPPLPDPFSTPAEPTQNFSAVAPRATGAFYFCRKCKKSGNRYELCASCHAVEVLQGEGKHAGPELHPHFLRCEHSSLVRRRFVNDANMGMPHIRRIFCDHCGHLAGSYDTDHEVFVCQRCPEEHGMRFELCARCAHDLKNYGWGVKRLRNAGARQPALAAGTMM